MIHKARSHICALAFTLGSRVLFAPAAAIASAPRGHVTLHTARVHLSDLFTDLAVDQDCDIGPAPAAGQSVTIGGAQLQAIAAQYGLDWPGASGTAQTTLTRASRSISSNELLPLITTALQERGAPSLPNIDLAPFQSPAIPEEESAPPHLRNLVYDASHGRLSAFFIVPAGDGATQSFRVDGVVSASTTVVVAARDIPPGQIVTREDLDIVTEDSRRIPARSLVDPRDAIGRAARAIIAKNTPLIPDLLVKQDVVEKGSPVILAVSSAGLRVTASGVALDGGGLGERIHVLNPSSHMVVIGEVIDKSRVDVLPGSIPAPADQRTLRAASQGTRSSI
ncbi:flagellar basal body P-ring formation chaperone FlgA [Acetobacter sacchari]|uniref:flagellar basal body P-ring formation chaperone FlgA n=1 Tax=Acetobacter sacchari TaxID=2661687 RepID=UPI00311CCF62